MSIKLTHICAKILIRSSLCRDTENAFQNENEDKTCIQSCAILLMMRFVNETKALIRLCCVVHSIPFCSFLGINYWNRTAKE